MRPNELAIACLSLCLLTGGKVCVSVWRRARVGRAQYMKNSTKREKETENNTAVSTEKIGLHIFLLTTLQDKADVGQLVVFKAKRLVPAQINYKVGFHVFSLHNKRSFVAWPQYNVQIWAFARKMCPEITVFRVNLTHDDLSYNPDTRTKSS